jgi:hypothetical protein
MECKKSLHKGTSRTRASGYLGTFTLNTLASFLALARDIMVSLRRDPGGYA